MRGHGGHPAAGALPPSPICCAAPTRHCGVCGISTPRTPFRRLSLNLICCLHVSILPQCERNQILRASLRSLRDELDEAHLHGEAQVGTSSVQASPADGCTPLRSRTLGLRLSLESTPAGTGTGTGASRAASGASSGSAAQRAPDEAVPPPPSVGHDRRKRVGVDIEWTTRELARLVCSRPTCPACPQPACRTQPPRVLGAVCLPLAPPRPAAGAHIPGAPPVSARPRPRPKPWRGACAQKLERSALLAANNTLRHDALQRQRLEPLPGPHRPRPAAAMRARSGHASSTQAAAAGPRAPRALGGRHARRRTAPASAPESAQAPRIAVAHGAAPRHASRSGRGGARAQVPAAENRAINDGEAWRAREHSSRPVTVYGRHEMRAALSALSEGVARLTLASRELRADLKAAGSSHPPGYVRPQYGDGIAVRRPRGGIAARQQPRGHGHAARLARRSPPRARAAASEHVQPPRLASA